VPALAKGHGAEIGWRFQPNEDLTTTLALWQLKLDSELAYVGDAGTTEPGRASTRSGIEVTARWRVNSALRAEVNAAWSRARFRGLPPEGEGNYVDNAVESVLAGGLTYIEGPWTASLWLRYLGPRALDTLNTVRSGANTVLNPSAGAMQQTGI